MRAVYLLDLKLLHFVEYASLRSEIEVGSPALADKLRRDRERYTDTVATQILARHLQNDPSQHLPKLILLGNPSELVKIRTTKAKWGGPFTRAWSHLVTALGGMAVYEQVCFYVVSAVLELSSGKNASRFSGRWRAGLVLETGRTYLIHVYQLTGNRAIPPSPGFKIQLEHIEGHLSPLYSEESIDGSYDRLSFFVSVVPQEQEKKESEMRLTCNQSVTHPTNPAIASPLPPSHLQLQIKWPLWDRIMKWVGYPVLLVVGAGLFVTAEEIQQFLAVGEAGKYLIQLFGLTLLALGGKNWGFLTGAFKPGPPGSRA